MLVKNTILVTGGAGVVGRALISELINQNYRVLALIRNRSLDIGGVECIKGDITFPNMGVDIEKVTQQFGKIDAVIHSAAYTNLGRTEQDLLTTNLHGTENVVKAANHFDARLIFVSTAYTHGANLNDQLNDFSSYSKSKKLAEEYVKEHSLNWKIVRPSVVVGDSETGEISQFQGFHNIFGAVMKRAVPVIPGLDEAFVDLVPQDILAKAICGLISYNGSENEFWITRGQNANRGKELYKQFGDYSQLYGCDVEMPKMVDPEVVERLFKPVFLPSFPKKLQKSLSQLIDYACYFNLNEPFPSNYELLVDELGLDPMPDRISVLKRNIEYWAEKTQYQEIMS